MKISIKKIGKGILILIIIWTVYIVINFVYDKVCDYLLYQSLGAGFEIISANEYKEDWKNSPSDITGWSVWDKYKKGLSIAENSDTDGDGLLDKDEIEIYGTDPLKVSTAGDLYSDYYKICNGMDVNQKYEYQGEMVFAYNECEEIKLVAETPTDFYAVVQRRETETMYNGSKLYIEYLVYNYDGYLYIDFDKVDSLNGVNLDDIQIYVSNGVKTNKVSFIDEGEYIKIKEGLKNNSTYEVYVVEKLDFLNNILINFSTIIPNLSSESDIVRGAGLVVDFPIFSWLFGMPVDIYYEDLGDNEKTEALKQNIINYTKDYIGLVDDNFVKEHVNESSSLVIHAQYELLKTILPFCDVTDVANKDLKWYHFVFAYYDYDKKTYESLSNVNEESVDTIVTDSVSGFNIMEDELPFGNFESEYGLSGNCAGIAHLTSSLYNKGMIETNGEYDGIQWNILTDESNQTLVNKGLSDYKDSLFVHEHCKDNIYLASDLSDGELEFVKMIGAFYREGNSKVNSLYQYTYGGENASNMFNYEMIEAMIDVLNSGNILDVYFAMNDGTGHTVNVYGYSVDSTDSSVIWFDIYDSNFPQNNSRGYGLSESGFKLKVTKKIALSGEGYSFDYEYSPVVDYDYGASSNIYKNDTPMMIVVDENWHDINPAVNKQGSLSNEEVYEVLSSSNIFKNKAKALSIVYAVAEPLYGEEFAYGLMANVFAEGNAGVVEYAFSKNHYWGFELPSGKTVIQNEQDVNYLLAWDASSKEKDEHGYQKGSVGVGLCQWSFGRRISVCTLYKEKCSQYFQDEYIGVEVQFMLNEFLQDYYRNKILTDETLSDCTEAAKAICLYYEVPADKNPKAIQRASYAEEIKALLTSAGLSNETDSNNKSKGQKVSDYAAQYVGSHYKWAGTKLGVYGWQENSEHLDHNKTEELKKTCPFDGADCSGFILAIYKYFGVDLPHSSSSFRSVGSEVSYENEDNLHEGDIVCYEGHVAIYIGDGKIVHASSHAKGVIISNNWQYKEVLTVRRIFE